MGNNEDFGYEKDDDLALRNEWGMGPGDEVLDD